MRPGYGCKSKVEEWVKCVLVAAEHWALKASWINVKIGRKKKQVNSQWRLCNPHKEALEI